MKKEKIFIFICLVLLSACSPSSLDGIVIEKAADGYKLSIDGRETYIKGVGGTYRLDIAAQSGANAFRTWGGNVEEIKKNLALASEHNMYVMQGIGMTKDSIRYYDDEYKNKMREEVRLLAETFKNDTSLLAWGIGNEIELGNANIAAAWNFVEELAQLIKSIDKRHLVSTVISYNPSALDSVAKYAPSLDYVGINVYGPMGEVYEERYTQYISANTRCLGSFVFVWGQKEERTPTWFSMFVEDKVDSLPLKGEKTPMVEAMQRVWTGKELDETAPIVRGMTIDGKSAIDNVRIKAGTLFKAEVSVTDKENDSLAYVWEVLKEATVLGFGGSYEPRPERMGDVAVSDKNVYETMIKVPGEYRLYVYVLDNTGFVSTANIPFQVID